MKYLILIASLALTGCVQPPDTAAPIAATLQATRPAILNAATFVQHDAHGQPARTLQVEAVDDRHGTFTLFDYTQFNYAHDLDSATIHWHEEITGEKTSTGLEIARDREISQCLVFQLSEDGQTLYTGLADSAEQDSDKPDSGCALVLDLAHPWEKL